MDRTSEHKLKVSRYFNNWKKVMRDPDITPLEKSILKDLEIYRNTRSGYAWPSLKTLADDMGMSISTIQRAVNRLTNLELLEVERKRGSVNKYVLTRGLCYPLLHEFEANYGHQRPYFEKSGDNTSPDTDKSKVTIEPKYGHPRPYTKVTHDLLTYSNELKPITNTIGEQRKSVHPPMESARVIDSTDKDSRNSNEEIDWEEIGYKPSIPIADTVDLVPRPLISTSDIDEIM